MNCDDLLPDSSTSSNDEVCTKQPKPSTCLAEFINTDESEVTSSSELENSEWMSNELINFWSILNDDDRLLIEDVFFKDSQEQNKDYSLRNILYKDKPHIKDKYEISQERTNSFLLPINCSSNNDGLIEALNLDIHPTTKKRSRLPSKSDSLLNTEKESLLKFETQVLKTDDFKPLSKSLEKLVLTFDADEKVELNDDIDLRLCTDIGSYLDSSFTEENYIKSMQYLNCFAPDSDLIPIEITSNDFTSVGSYENFEYEFINENVEVKEILLNLLDLLSTDSNSPVYLLKSTFKEYTELLESRSNKNSENEQSKDLSQIVPTENKNKSKNLSPPKLRRSNRIHENEQRDLADQIRKENQRREQRLLRQFKYTNQNIPTLSENDKNISDHMDIVQSGLEENVIAPQIYQQDETAQSIENSSVANLENISFDIPLEITNKVIPKERVTSKRVRQKSNTFSRQFKGSDATSEPASDYADINGEEINHGSVMDENIKSPLSNFEKDKNTFKQKFKSKIQDKRTKLYKMLMKTNFNSNDLIAKETSCEEDNEIAIIKDKSTAQKNSTDISLLKTDILVSRVSKILTNKNKQKIVSDHTNYSETDTETNKSSKSQLSKLTLLETKKDSCNDISKENTFDQKDNNKRKKTKSHSINLKVLEYNVDKNKTGSKNKNCKKISIEPRKILTTNCISSLNKEKSLKTGSLIKKDVNKKCKNIVDINSNAESISNSRTSPLPIRNLSKKIKSLGSVIRPDKIKNKEFVSVEKNKKYASNFSSTEALNAGNQIPNAENMIKASTYDLNKKKRSKVKSSHNNAQNINYRKETFSESQEKSQRKKDQIESTDTTSNFNESNINKNTCKILNEISKNPKTSKLKKIISKHSGEDDKNRINDLNTQRLIEDIPKDIIPQEEETSEIIPQLDECKKQIKSNIFKRIFKRKDDQHGSKCVSPRKSESSLERCESECIFNAQDLYAIQPNLENNLNYQSLDIHSYNSDSFEAILDTDNFTQHIENMDNQLGSSIKVLNNCDSNISANESIGFINENILIKNCNEIIEHCDNKLIDDTRDSIYEQESLVINNSEGNNADLTVQMFSDSENSMHQQFYYDKISDEESVDKNDASPEPQIIDQQGHIAEDVTSETSIMVFVRIENEESMNEFKYAKHLIDSDNSNNAISIIDSDTDNENNLQDSCAVSNLLSPKFDLQSNFCAISLDGIKEIEETNRVVFIESSLNEKDELSGIDENLEEDLNDDSFVINISDDENSSITEFFIDGKIDEVEQSKVVYSAMLNDGRYDISSPDDRNHEVEKGVNENVDNMEIIVHGDENLSINLQENLVKRQFNEKRIIDDGDIINNSILDDSSNLLESSNEGDTIDDDDMTIDLEDDRDELLLEIEDLLRDQESNLDTLDIGYANSVDISANDIRSGTRSNSKLFANNQIEAPINKIKIQDTLLNSIFSESLSPILNLKESSYSRNKKSNFLENTYSLPIASSSSTENLKANSIENDSPLSQMSVSSILMNSDQFEEVQIVMTDTSQEMKLDEIKTKFNEKIVMQHQNKIDIGKSMQYKIKIGENNYKPLQLKIDEDGVMQDEDGVMQHKIYIEDKINCNEEIENKSAIEIKTGEVLVSDLNYELINKLGEQSKKASKFSNFKENYLTGSGDRINTYESNIELIGAEYDKTDVHIDNNLKKDNNSDLTTISSKGDDSSVSMKLSIKLNKLDFESLKKLKRFASLSTDKLFKKEKSTDCDSALIPLHCVHG